MTEQALKALLNDLSLEEKVMQLVQLPGVAYESGAAVTGLLYDAAKSRALRLAGSTLGVWGAEKLNRLQKEYMENHPHHIPMLMMLDVIHGHKTVFPCPLGQGASFDPELAERAAAVQAREAAADGIHITFSPMADLSRDARWGRVMESTGEDKYLNGLMAAAMTRGYQGKALAAGDSVAACVKHFAAYGAAEAGRDYQHPELSEHTLREQYLPAYRCAVEAGGVPGHVLLQHLGRRAQLRQSLAHANGAAGGNGLFGRGDFRLERRGGIGESRHRQG
jgi:beta-glucosidase